MSIPIGELIIRVRDAVIIVRQNAMYEQAGYDIVHQPTDAIVGTGRGQVLVPNYEELETYDAKLYATFLSEYITWQAWHQGRSVLAGHSLQDATWTLEWWTFTPENGAWTIVHPLSGEWPGKTIATDPDGRPTLMGRLTAIYQEVLPPSTWTFAESPAAEQLRVWCAAVDGADHYNVYDDVGGQFFLLGQVPTNSPTIITVPAGSYSVRIAPVDSAGVIGILANTNHVSVAISGAAMASTFVSAPTEIRPSKPTVIPAEDKKVNLMDRVRRIFQRGEN